MSAVWTLVADAMPMDDHARRRAALHRWSLRAEAHATEFEEAGDVTSARIIRRLAEEARTAPPARPAPSPLAMTWTEATLLAGSVAASIIMLGLTFA